MHEDEIILAGAAVARSTGRANLRCYFQFAFDF